MDNRLIKAYVAITDIAPNSAVMFSGTDGKAVAQATGAASINVGVCEIGGKAGEHVDVVRFGFAEVRVSEPVTIGMNVRPGGVNGSILHAGSAAQRLGRAEEAGAPGDIITVFVNPMPNVNP